MESGSGEGFESSAMDDYESLISTTDVEILKRAWRNEKAAPEILQYEASLVQRSQEQIQLMEENIEESMGSGNDPLTVSLYQMDLDRTLFLLRSYLRTRLLKIEKYTSHIQKTAEIWDRLSRQEQKFAKRCIDDIENHLDTSVLSKLPDRYKSSTKQSIISEEDDMIPEPQLDTFVVCRAKRYLGAFQLDDSGESEPFDMDTEDVCFLRYKAIKPLVYSGQIDLV
ncbi:DNA replication complex GINS protein SLD5 [Impatiens glandulifera]|uniref:DNA replication complex GINS protein SLD5 n=1 Tax=Impatiens glandulifera TaxID=253017 RepID=UPI001FB18B27|nr:DNA replication complex GINS protein SLD5 [Impatiens glandulifera]